MKLNYLLSSCPKNLPKLQGIAVLSPRALRNLVLKCFHALAVNEIKRSMLLLSVEGPFAALSAFAKELGAMLKVFLYLTRIPFPVRKSVSAPSVMPPFSRWKRLSLLLTRFRLPTWLAYSALKSNKNFLSVVVKTCCVAALRPWMNWMPLRKGKNKKGKSAKGWSVKLHNLKLLSFLCL